jgi:hypothetical protein
MEEPATADIFGLMRRNMKTRKLGNSDLEITPIGFGAWAIGGDWKFGWGAQQDDDSTAAIHRALELGSGIPKELWQRHWPTGPGRALTCSRNAE